MSGDLNELVRGIEDEAQAYVASRNEATLVLGLTVQGERHVRAFRSPDASHVPLPDERTMYEIGSVSKVFSTTVLALLEGQGVVGLEDPIARHLPEHLDLPEDVGSLTLRQLATHSSGLGHVGALHEDLITEETRGTETPFGTYTHYLRYRKEHLYADLENAELAYPTDQGWMYSILGMGTLGHILELATGRGYEDLLKESVCAPLGLHDTGYTLSPDQRDRMMYAYDAHGQPLPNWYHDVMLPQGGLRSSLADVLTFVEANLRAGADPDDRSPTATALRRARQQHAEPPPPGFTHPLGEDLPDFVQGLGWRGLPRPQGLAWWHPGTTLFYLADAAVDDHAAVGLVVLSSQSRSLVDREEQHLLRGEWFQRGCRVGAALRS